MKIIESRPVSITEAKDLLEERAKKSELEYEQEQAANHTSKFSKCNLKETQKLAAAITSKFEKIDLELALKIVDILPKHPETLKSIFLRRRVDLNDEEMNELLKIITK